MGRFTSVACACCVLVLMSCGDRVEIINTGYFNPLRFELSQFPNMVGASWTYSVYDSIAQQRDTVAVSIVGQTILPNNKVATLWQYTSRSGVDTQYVFTSGDSLWIADDLNAQFIRTTYVFPLQVGKVWKGRFLNDSVTVMRRVAVVVPVGRFDNAFELEEEWGLLNDYGRTVSWLVPNVGLVRMHKQLWGWGIANSTWELMSFAIPER